MHFRYVAQPQPHLVVDEIVSPDVYATLPFPDDLISDRDAWGITASDAEYATVLEHPGWRALDGELRSEAFVTSVLRAFAADMERLGCLVDPDHAQVIPFNESRAEKAMASLDRDADPNEIFTRLDFQSKKAGGYRDFVHLDWSRRITGGILFFSDADEEGLEGGELAFYLDRGFRNDRWCHDPEPVANFRPRANSGVIFLNWNGAFHGPRAIKRLRGRRRWLYYAISSRRDVWPHD
ncbi:MAG TPA: 2OG-Fe(II) oxygenase [Thermoanaerobaculia bacterium]